METSRTLLALGVTIALLGGCKKQEDAAPAAAEPVAAATAEPAPSVPAPAAAEAAAPAAAAPGTRFDLAALPVSTAALPAWPYLVPPAGYEFDDANRLQERTKDLARIPVWTGGQLLWVEGRVFSDGIENADGKTFSRFELAKGLRQQIEALGGVRVSERSYARDFYAANEKALDDFRQEFDDLQDAYWYDKDVDTYAIRRADGVVWVVLQTRNEDAAVLVAEGPAPTAD
ncbi:hypothetical protein [Pseudoxanthomonas kaohsiungensis]|uniref:Uncharacterized protein n=1 Tax=Pseudoxanthomonas kaohsiungensis TaxID=283923 RepID=A0ABW3M061_9GAMM|nr:hypothetical protein [Pseudoxanthomonas kaohsiungensis]